MLAVFAGSLPGVLLSVKVEAGQREMPYREVSEHMGMPYLPVTANRQLLQGHVGKKGASVYEYLLFCLLVFVC